MTAKIVFTILTLAILAIGCAQSPTGEVVSEKQTVKIGVILPLSGDNAQLGVWGTNGAELALKEINAQDTRYNYKIIYEDDQLNSKLTASAANKLVSVDAIDALITISSGSGNAAKPIATQGGVPHFAVASDGSIADGKMNFIHWTSPAAEAKRMLEEMTQRGHKTLAMINLNQQGVKAIEDELVKQSKDHGIDVVFVDHINPGTNEFRTVLLKMNQKNPDLVLFMMFDPEYDMIMTQYQQLGMKTPYSSIEVPSFVKDPSAFEGKWFVSAAVETKEFQDRYFGVYGEKPGFASANIYDAVKIIADASEEAETEKTLNSETIAAYVRGLKDYDGALGRLTTQPDGIIWSDAALYTIKDGKPVALE